MVACIALAALFLSAGCAVTTRMQTESQSVSLGSAKLVRAEIKMDAGDLGVGAGADELLEADFTYNVASWKPKIRYEVSGKQGELTVEQPYGARGVPLGKVRNEWNIRLNDDVPMELNVKLGAGKSNLKLSSLSLTKLDIEMGAGDVKADLSGSQSLTEFNMKMGAGDAEVDLSGDWKYDLDANLKGGVGNATLLLPKDVGVYVDVKGGLGEINTSGLIRDGSTYVNEAYGKSKVTLLIDIKGGVGEINLEIGE